MLVLAGGAAKRKQLPGLIAQILALYPPSPGEKVTGLLFVEHTVGTGAAGSQFLGHCDLLFYSCDFLTFTGDEVDLMPGSGESRIPELAGYMYE